MTVKTHDGGIWIQRQGKHDFRINFCMPVMVKRTPVWETKTLRPTFLRREKNASKDTNLLNRQGRDLTTVYQKTHPSWVFICQTLHKRSVNQHILK